MIKKDGLVQMIFQIQRAVFLWGSRCVLDVNL